MAEGLLEGVFGGEEEKIDPTVGGTEPIVAAVAADLAGQHPEVAAKTAAMFDRQTRLLELQCKNVEAEYEFFESEAGPRLLALRLRTGFQLFFALFATVIGLGAAVLVYDALTSRRVVMMDGASRTAEGVRYNWTLTGTNTGSGGTGKSVRISGFELWRFGADGLVAESLGYYDAADYQRQLGTGN
jgi:hypothetical protein